MSIKKIYLFVFILLLATIFSCKAQKPFKTSIYSPEIESVELRQALEDVKTLLIAKTQSIDVELKHKDEAEFQINLTDNEPNFYIESDQNKLRIYGTDNDLSYINGIYYYLDRLGFRFLNYSDRWIYRPRKVEHPSIRGKIIRRKVENLGYFGTGGLGLDKEMATTVKRYQLRNGWTSKVGGVPHMFEYFYKQNKAYIDRNPTILTDYEGRKKDPNLDNPLTMPLVKKWIRDKIIKDPQKYQYHISVSPADGLSSKTIKLPSSMPFIQTINEKNIWIANEVAEYLGQELSEWDGYVTYNVYGNGEGSVTPPDFKLHPKVWLQFFPYAFQRDYKTDQELFIDWNRIHFKQKKSISDYWNITQWSEGLPQSDLYSLVKTRLPLWLNQNFDGIKMESTYFSAVTAPHFYVTSQYLKGYNQKSIDDLYAEFYQLSFGNGAKDIEIMYKRWSANFTGECELPYALKNLNNAYSKAQKVEERNRIVELMAYVHWMRLHYETKKNPTELNALKLERYAKKIRSLAVVQSYTVWRYNYGNIKPYKFGESPDEWDEYLSDETFSILKPYILSNFRKDVKDYPVTYSFSMFRKSDNRVTLKKSLVDQDHREVLDATYLSSKTTYSFTPERSEVYIFQWVAKNLRDKVVVNQGQKGERIFYASSIGKNRTEVNVNSSKTYTISFIPDKKSNIQYILPDKTTFFYEEGRFASSNARNTWYFYVPKDVKEILIKPFVKDGYTVTKGKMSALFMPVGNNFQLVEPKRVNGKYEQLYEGVYKIPVPSDKAGRVWKLKMRVDKWKILNFEPILSKTKFSFVE